MVSNHSRSKQDGDKEKTLGPAPPSAYRGGSGPGRHEPPEFPEGNDRVLSKGPCPKCPTEYGNVTYEDGHAHCFACGHDTKRPGDGGPSAPTGSRSGQHQALSGGDAVNRRPDTSAHLLRPSDASDPYPNFLDKRKLKGSTLRRYGYFVGAFSGKPVHVAPYFDQAGEPAGQKLRFLTDKSFTTVKASPTSPSIGDCRLFGHQVYGDKHDKRVVITEGELDAMSVAQACDFKFPAVSVNTGAKGAAKCIKQNWLWLDRYEEIILWFDDDEPGHEAAEECAQLFAVGKVRIAKVTGFKDASDVLQADRPGDIEAAIFMATSWRPAGIVNAADNADDVLASSPESKSAWSYDWPWPGVQETVGPMLPGQVCYQVAGTGIGKSTAIAEIEYNLMAQGCKVGHMGFEDTRRDVKLRIMGIEANQRLDITPLPDAEMRKLHDKVFGDKRLFELFDPETAEWSVDAILGYVRYMAKALDCRVIFIDPLTFIAAGMSLGDDERRALDKAARDLAAMAKELGVHLQVVHHLTDPRDGKGHTEGAKTHLNQIRGSGGIANFGVIVIGHERDTQAGEGKEFLTQLRALKNRPRSIQGPMQVLRYDLQTGRLKPTKEPFPERAETGKGRNFPSAASGSSSNDY